MESLVLHLGSSEAGAAPAEVLALSESSPEKKYVSVEFELVAVHADLKVSQ